MTDGTIFCDIECFPNYFLIKFRNEEGRFREFVLDENNNLDVRTLRNLLFSYTTVTFNGNSYDWPMIALALSGADNETLKAASDHIIVGDIKPWQFYKHYKIQELSYDHIDIIEVVPGVRVSLKSYAGRIHSEKMQDLPYNPNNYLTEEQKKEINNYCSNDLEVTAQLYEKAHERIKLREVMSKEYSIDLRSKSDAQVAEAVIKTELFKLTRQKLQKPSHKKREFHYIPPEYISFSTKPLQSILDMVLETPFVAESNGVIKMSDELSDATIQIGNSRYNLGIGGLHSQESEQSVLAGNGYRIYDRDFTSYYPFIILNNEFFPPNIGREFLDVYRTIVERRLTAKGLSKKAATEEERKVSKDIAESLKITINGTFGKLGSIYSVIYAPELMVQVTVTGQLTLLMLIEQLEDNGISVVSANTDGIVCKCPDDKRGIMLTIFDNFEKLTRYQTEEVEYVGLYSRDVNNYVAIKTDGEVKTKGTFSNGSIVKNPENDVCNDALIEYLKNGTPFEETIRGCKDVRRFVTIRTVRGGGHLIDADVTTAFTDDNYLGKVVRWYHAVNANTTINYKTSGNKVPRTDGCRPLMQLPVEIPTDIDYNWYIKEAEELLMDIGLKERPPKVRKTRSKK